MYINQQDAQNSCVQTLFSIRCSTCFGLYQSIIRSNFISCTSHLVYASICRYHTSGCCVATDPTVLYLLSQTIYFLQTLKYRSNSVIISNFVLDFKKRQYFLSSRYNRLTRYSINPDHFDVSPILRSPSALTLLRHINGTPKGRLSTFIRPCLNI